jgi:hypothetical protein
MLQISRGLRIGGWTCYVICTVSGIGDGREGFRSGHDCTQGRYLVHGNHDQAAHMEGTCCWKETSSSRRMVDWIRLIDAFRLFSPKRFFLDGTTQLIACTTTTTTAITHTSPDQRLYEPCSECIACSLLAACCTDRHRRVPHYSILH